MADILAPVVNPAEQLRLGDHAALFYGTRAEQFACVIPYIQAGLERNERCLYIADDNSVPVILNRLEHAGVDVDAALGRGALRVATKQETYLRHGLFEPENMIADLKEEVQSSLGQGFTGFRATGEMTWALDLPSALAQILDYEEALHAQFPAQLIGLCQYDETRFPPHIIRTVINLHSLVIKEGRITRNNPSEKERGGPTAEPSL